MGAHGRGLVMASWPPAVTYTAQDYRREVGTGPIDGSYPPDPPDDEVPGTVAVWVCKDCGEVTPYGTSRCLVCYAKNCIKAGIPDPTDLVREEVLRWRLRGWERGPDTAIAKARDELAQEAGTK